MSKNWMMLTGLLFLSSVGTSQAHPLDSPDMLYRWFAVQHACQSYMAWSRQQTSSMTRQSALAKPAREKPWRRSLYKSSKPAVHVRVAKQAVLLPPAKIAGLQPAGDAAVASEPARANVAASPAAAGATATSDARSVQQQVSAATALAEHVTAASAAPVPQQQANNAEASGRSEAVQTEPTASAQRLGGYAKGIAKITATRRLTRSAASAGSRWYWPSAHRYSIATFRPSTNLASLRQRRNAASRCANLRMFRHPRRLV